MFCAILIESVIVKHNEPVYGSVVDGHGIRTHGVLVIMNFRIKPSREENPCKCEEGRTATFSLRQ